MKKQLIERDSLIETMEKIFDPIPVPIILVDRYMRIQLINRAFARYLGYKKNQMVGKNVMDMDQNTRWPEVFKSKKAEIAWKHTFQNGKTAIVHRIPVLDTNNEIDYGFGMVLFETVDEMKEIIAKNRLLESKVKLYEEQLSKIGLAKYQWDHIIGENPAVIKIKKEAKKAAGTISNILLTGESGTGKELFAHAIHHESNRSQGPFIKVNCAAIPAQLLESEFFGYEKGAFTGALDKGKKGKFELADNGTIFLDEIGDMSLDVQAKLLRVIQEREFERIGGDKTIRVDVRVIAATNKDLQDMYKSSRFRQDLFFRLNVVSLNIPPLRERMSDIPLLTRGLMDKLSAKLDKSLIPVTPEALDVLRSYHWPGNIRELENILERAMILNEKGEITPEYLSVPVQSDSDQGIDAVGKLKIIMDAAEKKAVMNSLEQANHNRSEAARILGISRSNLYDRLKKFNI